MASSQVSSGSQQTVASRLVDAAMLGQVEIVRDLLRKNPNVVDSLVNGQNALQWASNKGHIDVVQVLLEAGANKETKNNHGLSALECAVVGNRLAAVKMLLEKGADCNSKDKNGNTPLNNSIWCEHGDVMKLLLSHPKTDISIKNNDGNNALHFAILTNKEINRLAAVKMLLEKGADCNSQDNDGDTALNNSIWNGHEDVMKLLLSHPKTDISIKNNNGYNALHCAIWTNKEINRLAAVKMLLEKGADCNSQDNDGDTALNNSIWNGHEDVMKLLLSHPKTDISIKNNNGYNALHCAIWTNKEINRPEAVKTLLEKGVDINSTDNNGRTPLHNAIWRENKKVIELLINHPKIDVSIKDNEGYNALHYAIKVEKEINRPEAVKTLLDKGLDINSTDNGGRTPLHNAIWRDNKKVIELLINHPKIDLSIKDNQGNSALRYAIMIDKEINRPEAVKTLLDKGLDINSTDNGGRTPLHNAIWRDNKKVIELLINHPKIDLSIKDNQGNSALRYAIMIDKEINRPEAVKTLLDKGLDINSTDNTGRTLLHNAIWRENKEVIELLINHRKIDVSIKDNQGYNALHYAIMVEKEINRPEVIQILLQKGPEVNSVDNDGNTSLHLAVNKGYKNVIELLSSHPKIDFSIKNKKGLNALHLAVLEMKEIDRKATIQIMLQKGAEINSEDIYRNTALHHAAFVGCKEVVELLINDPNIDINLKNKKGCNVLHFALRSNNRLDIMQLLLQKDADINSVDNDGNTPLHDAIYRGQKEVMELLINHPRTDFQIKNKSGFNVLHFAVLKVDVVYLIEVVQLMLQKGVDINSVDSYGDTTLHHAIREGCTDVMEFLIKHPKIDLNLKNNKGFDVLHLAVLIDDVVFSLEVIRLLLQQGADVNSFDIQDNTAVHSAILRGDKEVLEVLLNHPNIDFNLKNKQGYNVLHFALRGQSALPPADVLRLLLQKGAEINSLDNLGNTILHSAISMRDKDIIELLVNYPNIDFTFQNGEGFNVLHFALRLKDVVFAMEVAELLLRTGANVNSLDKEGNSALHSAIYRGDKEIMELLVKHPEIDFSLKNKQGFNVLHFALREDNVGSPAKVIQLLLQNGAKINSVDNSMNTLLHNAIYMGNKEVMELLASLPETDFSLKNNQGYNVLHFALHGENGVPAQEVIDLLLRKGADVNSMDNDGNTVFHSAIYMGNNEVMELLTSDQNIDLSLKNKQGYNVLHFAIREENVPNRTGVLQWLLKKGVDINSVDEDGNTAMHHAVNMGDREVMAILINQPKIDLSLKNKNGDDVIHFALRGNNDINLLGVVQMLLQKGADVNSVDNDGNTSLHQAINMGHKEVMKLLINHPKIDFSLKNNQGLNVLHLAVQGDTVLNKREILQMMLQKGAGVNSVDIHGNPSLHHSLLKGDVEVTELLINQPEIDFNLKNERGLNALHFVLREENVANRLKAMQLLTQKGADVNSMDSDRNTLLHSAIDMWDIEFMEFLINHPRIDFKIENKKGFNALHHAVLKVEVANRKNVLKLMLQKGAEINSVAKDGNAPLHQAIYFGDKEAMELLINHPNTDFSIKNKQGFDVLHFALRVGNVINQAEVIKMLLQKGANINSVDNEGNTSLHHAVYMGYKEAIEVLIGDPKIDFSLKNKNGDDVLHFVLKAEEVVHRTEVMKMLVHKGADINSLDSKEDTLLHNAIRKGYKEIIEQLTDQPKIDFSLKNRNGYNVLHYTVFGSDVVNRQEIMHLLLQRGADINFVDHQGNTALHIAVCLRNKEAIEILISHPEIDFSVKNKRGLNALHLAAHGMNVVVSPNGHILAVGMEDQSVEFYDLTKGQNLNKAELYNDTESCIINMDFSTDSKYIRVCTKDCVKVYTVPDGNLVDDETITENMTWVSWTSNQAEIVQLLLLKGAEVNSMDFGGNTALHHAIDAGYKEVIQLLISCPNIDFSLKNIKGFNFLHRAVLGTRVVNRPDVVQMLIEKGADVNSVDCDGNTTLHHAISLGYKEITELLINHPMIDLRLKNKQGLNALHFAVLFKKVANQLEVLQLLLQKGAEINSESDMGNTSLHMAIENGNAEVIELLIHNPNIDFSLKNKQGLNVLHFAVLVPDVIHRLEILKVMLQNGADVNSDSMIGNTALHMAIDNGVTEVLEVLINDPKIDFSLKNKQGFNVLHRAVLAINMANRKEVLQLMLQKGADVNSADDYGDTPLHHAIYMKDKEVIKILINQPNINFSLKNKNGHNALHFAVGEGAERVTALILQNQPDLINSKDEEGRTALHFAAHNGQVQTAKLLIEKGADVNISDNKQQTPLHVAVRKACLPVVELIVANNAELNIRDEHGNTCLHLAVKEHSGHPSADVGPAWSKILDQVGLDDKTGFTITCFLVKTGADVNIVNNEGLTPSEMIQDPVKNEAFKKLIEAFTFQI